MVSGIGSVSSYQYQSQTSASSSLTDEQKETLAEILANYDADSITEEETKSMMDEIKEAGITPSKEFGEIMNSAGFKPPEKPEGPPPKEAVSSSQELPEYLQDFITKEESGSVSQSDIDSLISSLQSSGKMAQGTFVDQKV
jgi:hypothetical protein